MADTEHNFPFSPYNYCINNPILLVDPNGEDWFVNRNDGSMIFLSGQEEMNQEYLEILNTANGTEFTMDNFEHIGEDGMFDTDELNVSGVLADNGFDQFYMTSEGAGIFMDNMGYEKIIQKTTVTDSYITEDYEPSGKIETSSSRTQVTEQVEYKKPYSEGHYPQVLWREMPEQRQFYYGQSSEIKGPYRPTLMLIHTKTVTKEIIPANNRVANNRTSTKNNMNTSPIYNIINNLLDLYR